MISYLRIAVAAGVLASIGGAFAYGMSLGVTKTEAKFEEKRVELQGEILDLNQNLNVLNEENLALMRMNEDLINDLENQALSAEGASNDGVSSTGGLRRLERRWGGNP